MADLYRLVGEVTFDNLIAGNYPAPDVGIRTLRREGAEETTYPMGTVLAQSSRDGLLKILGTQALAAVIEVAEVKGKYTITISTAGAEGDTLKLTAGGVEKTYTVEGAAGEIWPANDIAGDCAALQALIEADFPAYTVTNTATTVVLEQKVGAEEDAAAIVVTQVAAPAGLEAVVAENPAGVTYVAPLAEEVLTPSYILAADTTVGLAADVNAPVFRAGCFAPENITVADQHVFSAAEKDALRQRNLVFKSSYHE
ncbi:MAG: hypothetical protein PHH32_02405 [Eubacteriales bacterium]|nr:hypothetical protein [Eubacteriales bacterium]